MKKRKRLIVFGAVTLALAFGLLTGLVIKSQYNKIKHRKLPGVVYVDKKVSPKVIEVDQDSSVKDYNSIKSLVDNKKWSEVVAKAIAYGEVDKNGIILRISAYGECVYAASIINDSASVVLCGEKADGVILLLPEDRRDLNKKTFDAISKHAAYPAELKNGAPSA